LQRISFFDSTLNYNHSPVDRFELQDRHGFNRVDESGLAGITQLKELLANPPREVVEQIARETQNPGLLSELAHAPHP